ncbi:FtsQ-type POTRA domain-containing protein [Clostridium cadaveris]|uniref:cell division protein FtsQ/DivIB n=1 Tax=Clostridium cadaveris TaxID=1529 RepID=UPI0025A3533A|nr:FtsQ-type POTRA domain-containing protein [Clostridium cadaveris]MDM8312468.1 FtsQ-type POTRA domain-containing protein [Clostridium cadaveris]
METHKKSYSKEELKKRVAKKRRRKAIFICLFLLAVLVTVCFNIPYFNIQTIDISKNNILTESEVSWLNQKYLGQNIFTASKEGIRNDLKAQPYIKNAVISKKFPNKLVITLEQTQGKFFVEHEKKYYIFDEELNLLEVKDDISDLNLVSLIGIDINSVNVGEKVNGYEKIDKILNEISNLIDDNLTDIVISSVNVEDISNIKIYCGKLEVKIGTGDELKDKLNKAFNIILQDKALLENNGYIDVSFKGNPVVYRQD